MAVGVFVAVGETVVDVGGRFVGVWDGGAVVVVLCVDESFWLDFRQPASSNPPETVPSDVSNLRRVKAVIDKCSLAVSIISLSKWFPMWIGCHDLECKLLSDRLGSREAVSNRSVRRIWVDVLLPTALIYSAQLHIIFVTTQDRRFGVFSRSLLAVSSRFKVVCSERPKLDVQSV